MCSKPRFLGRIGSWTLLLVALLFDLGGGAVNGPTLVFPQFANGQGNSTRIILRNNDNAVDSGVIRFRDGAGNPIDVPIGGDSSSTLAYDLQPFATLDVTTAGTGPLIDGSIEVSSDRGLDSLLEGSIIFELLGFKTSVPNAVIRPTNQIYVSRDASENTALAVFNPSRDQTVNLLLRLNDEAGNFGAFREMALGPGQRVATFLDSPELFQDFFQGVSNFQGTLNMFFVDLQDSVAALGLILNSDGSLTATSVSAGGDFVLPPGSLTASLCGCTAAIDPENSGGVNYSYGVEGTGAAMLNGNNRLTAVLFNDEQLLVTGSGFQNEPILGCGQRTGLSIFSTVIFSGTANILELRMESLDEIVTVEPCRVNFRE